MNSASESSSDTNDESDYTNYTSHVNERKIRERRQIMRPSCGVNNQELIRPRIAWPPQDPSTSNWRGLRPVRLGNAMYGTKMQLYSLTRHHLAVYPDGTVRGTQDENDLHTFLELISVQHAGHVRIKGLLTNLYVAMNNKGLLYGEPDITEEGTVFIESFQGSYNAYLSRRFAHLGWYIGIKKFGTVPMQDFIDLENIPGNPNLGSVMRLYCERGFNLTIRSNGEVLGTTDDDDPDSVMEVISAEEVGKVFIKSRENDLFLTFNQQGNLYGEVDQNRATVFDEFFQGSYNGYKIRVNDDSCWYVAINKRGRQKNGNKTDFGQKATKFLPRRL